VHDRKVRFTSERLVSRFSQRATLASAVAAGCVAVAVAAPASSFGFAGYVAAIATCHAVGMAAPSRTIAGWRAGLELTVCVAFVVGGAISIGVKVAASGWVAGAAFALVAACIVGVLPLPWTGTQAVHPSESHWAYRLIGYVRLAVGAIVGPIYAGWLISHQHADPAALDAAWGVGGVVVISSTLWVITGRFPQLVEAEKTVDDPGGGRQLDRFAPMLWTQVVAFTLSGLLALAVLIVALAGPRHFDLPTYADPSHALVIAGVLLTAVVLSGIGYICARRAAPWSGDPQRGSIVELRSDHASTAALLTGLLILIIGPAVLNGEGGSFRAEAFVVSGVLAAYVAEFVFADGVWLQLTSPNWSSGLLLLLMPLATFSPLCWLLQSGLWSHGYPARIESAVPLTLCVLISTAAVAAFVGASLGWRAPRLLRTLHRPGQNAVQDSLVAGVIGLLAGPLPAVIAARSENGSGGVIAGQLIVLVAILGAIAWTVRHDFDHVMRERRRMTAYASAEQAVTVSGQRDKKEQLSPELERERVSRVQLRIYWWQVPVPLVLLGASTLWLLLHLT
jgi:hypothetical protein